MELDKNLRQGQESEDHAQESKQKESIESVGDNSEEILIEDGARGSKIFLRSSKVGIKELIKEGVKLQRTFFDHKSPLFKRSYTG